MRVLVLRSEDGFPDGPDDPAARVVYDGPGERCRDDDVVDGVTYGYLAWTFDEVPLHSAARGARARRPNPPHPN